MTDDRSAVGVHHTDDRTVYALVYDGEELIAKLYNRDLVKEFENCGWFTVSRTPEGENLAV